MHIVLTTPWEAGSIDDGRTYPHAKIVAFEIGIARNKHVTITVEFGQYVNNAWVRGENGRYRIRLANDEFTAFLQANSSLLQALQAALYETVQARDPVHAAGTIG